MAAMNLKGKGDIKWEQMLLNILSIDHAGLNPLYKY